MFDAVLLFAFTLAVMWSQVTCKAFLTDEPCNKLLHSTDTYCCIIHPPKPEMSSEEAPTEATPEKEPTSEEKEVQEERMRKLKDCLKLSGEHEECDRRMCIAITKGFATPDKNLIKPVISQMYDDHFTGHPALLKALKENCLHGDVSIYGPEDMCYLMKYEACEGIQSLKNCLSWNNASRCDGIKEMADKCVKLFP